MAFLASRLLQAVDYYYHGCCYVHAVHAKEVPQRRRQYTVIIICSADKTCGSGCMMLLSSVRASFTWTMDVDL